MASNSQKTASRGGEPSSSPDPISVRRPNNKMPVNIRLNRFNSAVTALNVVTVSSLPQTISLRSAGLHSNVSNVPRSFSPAHRSTAG